MKSSLFALLGLSVLMGVDPMNNNSPVPAEPDMQYEIYGNAFQRAKMEKLANAATLSDIFPNFPASWIEEYINVELAVMIDGELTKVTGTNDTLNPEQKSILKKLDPGTLIMMDADYRRTNAVTGVLEPGHMHHRTFAVPETEASYPGGPEAMAKYFSDACTWPIAAQMDPSFKESVVQFTIDEKGNVTDVRLLWSSGNTLADGCLFETVSRMPVWTPARNSKDKKMKQTISVRIYNAAQTSGC
ncbi:MAG: energy transducer TonB [Flavobacteriales bacterium]|nr:energy transducer TonB [Flavobacteriales bacterium]